MTRPNWTNEVVGLERTGDHPILRRVVRLPFTKEEGRQFADGWRQHLDHRARRRRLWGRTYVASRERARYLARGMQ